MDQREDHNLEVEHRIVEEVVDLVADHTRERNRIEDKNDWMRMRCL